MGKSEQDIIQADYKKRFLTLSIYIQGALGACEEKHLKDWARAAQAMEYAAKRHTGKRKDKVTPEYQHYPEIARAA